MTNAPKHKRPNPVPFIAFEAAGARAERFNRRAAILCGLSSAAAIAASITAAILATRK